MKAFKGDKLEKVNMWEGTSRKKRICRFLWCHLWIDQSLCLIEGEFISSLETEKGKIWQAIQHGLTMS